MSAAPPQAILFLGATGGVGQTALRESLAAGYTCIALARSASKLAGLLPSPSYPNLTIIEGNARDQATLERALVVPASASSASAALPPQRMVDVVVSSVGSLPSLRNMGMEDPTVCETAMRALLLAIEAVRARGAGAGANNNLLPTPPPPRIVALSSTGISKFGRDVPVAFVPLYYVALAMPHRDKKSMEDLLVRGVFVAGDDEEKKKKKDNNTEVSPAAEAQSQRPEFTIIRGSLYVAEDEANKKKAVRVGVEDPVKGVESKAIGYTISREAIGRWIFTNLLRDPAEASRYSGKMVTLTY